MFGRVPVVQKNLKLDILALKNQPSKRLRIFYAYMSYPVDKKTEHRR